MVCKLQHCLYKVQIVCNLQYCVHNAQIVLDTPMTKSNFCAKLHYSLQFVLDWAKQEEDKRWQKSAFMLLNSAFLLLALFSIIHTNTIAVSSYSRITKINLNICTKILLKGVEWPLRPGLWGKNIAEIASD